MSGTYTNILKMIKKTKKKIFDQYFDIFPWDQDNLSEFDCLDIGCGDLEDGQKYCRLK